MSRAPSRLSSTIVLEGELGRIVVLVIPDLPEVVLGLAVLAGEDHRGILLSPSDAQKVRRHLVLQAGGVRDARLVLAGDIREVVDPRGHLELECPIYLSFGDDAERAPRRHGRELLQRLSVPSA